MVTRGRLHKFIAKRCGEIRHQVKEFCATRDPEALHVLRVETKKLRASLRLLQASTGQDHHDAKGLRSVYKTAGTIRTAQINLKILQDLKLDNPAFVREQDKIIGETSATFCKEAQHYRHKLHSFQDHLEASTQDVKSEKVKSFFRDRIAKLSLFFSAGTLDTAGLHNARKETKELMYVYALLPPALAASLGVNTAYLDQIQHKIGDWHDNTVTLSLLQGFGNADPALVGELQRAEAAHLAEIKTLATGFDQKISITANEIVNSDTGIGARH